MSIRFQSIMASIFILVLVSACASRETEELTLDAITDKTMSTTVEGELVSSETSIPPTFTSIAATITETLASARNENNQTLQTWWLMQSWPGSTIKPVS
jgi:hypothetical protein